MNPTHTLPVLALAALMTGCGGSGPEATEVELCLADLKPHLVACTGHAYDGKDTTAFKACLAANVPLTRATMQCRDRGPAEFLSLADHVVGHAAANVLSVMTGTEPPSIQHP